MPTSGPRRPRRAWIDAGSWAGSSAARAVTPAPTTGRRIRSSWPPCGRRNSTRPPSRGLRRITFLHQPDGALANDLALREHLVREIRTFKPDAVLAVDPEALFYGDGGVNHMDHRAAGFAAVDAVYPAARNGMAFPWLARDGLAPHVVRRLYPFWSSRPTAWVDVSATLDRKIDALRAHPSQMRHPEELEPRIREWAKEEGDAARRRGGGGAPGDRDREDDEGGSRARHDGPRPRPGGRALVGGEQCGPHAAPGVPELGEVRGARARRSTISPRVRSPACSASHSSAATTARS